MFVGDGQFLDREGDSGQRRIERGRNAGSTARNHHAGRHAQAKQPMDLYHYRAGQLHRRPFAPHRCAAQQCNDCQDDLRQCSAQGKQCAGDAPHRLAAGGHDLRYAGTARLTGETTGQHGHEQERQRGQDQRKIDVIMAQRGEHRLRAIAQFGKEQRGQADQYRRNQHGDAPVPVVRTDQFLRHLACQKPGSAGNERHRSALYGRRRNESSGPRAVPSTPSMCSRAV